MTQQTQGPSDIVFTPSQVSTLTLNQIRKIEKTREDAVEVRIPGLRKELKTLRPGTLTTVIALSSNWKTGLMQSIARDTAAGLSGKDCVVYATWEVAIEEMGVMDLASATQLDVADVLSGNVKDWRAMEGAAIARAQVPIYAIGHSMDEENRKKRPRLSMTNLALALRVMENEMGLRPRLILLDYLQRIQRDGDGSQPRLEFSENVDRAKDMSLAMACPVVLGCQAKEEVMRRDMKLPRMNDGMETSNVMHSSDNVITLWRPCVTEGVGARFKMFGGEYEATEDLLITHIAKQKFGKMGGWWPLSVDFARGRVKGEIDYTHVDLRDYDNE